MSHARKITSSPLCGERIEATRHGETLRGVVASRMYAYDTSSIKKFWAKMENGETWEFDYPYDGVRLAPRLRSNLSFVEQERRRIAGECAKLCTKKAFLELDYDTLKVIADTVGVEALTREEVEAREFNESRKA